MAQPNGHDDVRFRDDEGAAARMADERWYGAPAAEERWYGAPRVEERPISELFQNLAQDVRNLVNLEVTLARTELTEKAAQAGKAASFMAAGGFVMYAGFLAIVFAVIAILANFLPIWVSALIVGVVVALIGYALVRKGMNDLKGPSLAPQHTIDSLKEGKEWAQEQVR